MSEFTRWLSKKHPNYLKNGSIHEQEERPIPHFADPNEKKIAPIVPPNLIPDSPNVEDALGSDLSLYPLDYRSRARTLKIFRDFMLMYAPIDAQYLSYLSNTEGEKAINAGDFMKRKYWGDQWLPSSQSYFGYYFAPTSEQQKILKQKKDFDYLSEKYKWQYYDIYGDPFRGHYYRPKNEDEFRQTYNDLVTKKKRLQKQIEDWEKESDRAKDTFRTRQGISEKEKEKAYEKMDQERNLRNAFRDDPNLRIAIGTMNYGQLKDTYQGLKGDLALAEKTKIPQAIQEAKAAIAAFEKKILDLVRQQRGEALQFWNLHAPEFGSSSRSGVIGPSGVQGGAIRIPGSDGKKNEPLRIPGR